MTRISKFLQNIRMSDWAGVRSELLARVSRVTLTNWKQGVYEADSIYWKPINDIAEKYGYEKPYTL